MLFTRTLRCIIGGREAGMGDKDPSTVKLSVMSFWMITQAYLLWLSVEILRGAGMRAHWTTRQISGRTRGGLNYYLLF